MSRLLLLIVLLPLLAASPALAVEPESRATPVLRTRAESLVPGQAFDVMLLVGYDHAYFEKHAAPLFRQAMDVPMQLTLPWLEKPQGAERLPEVRVPTWGNTKPTQSLVFNGEIAEWSLFEKSDKPGHTSTRMARAFRFRAVAEGAIEIPAPTLRWAYAERFEEDFLGDRVAVDPRFIEVAGEPLRIEVKALPAGAPEGFAGAIGAGGGSAAIDRKSVKVGEPFRLTVRLDGHDNVDQIPTPKLLGVAGFSVLGVDDDRGAPQRTIVYEIAAEKAGVQALGPIRFPYFDPRAEGGTYVVALSDALEIEVLPDPEAPAAQGEDSAGWPAWARWPSWPYALLACLVTFWVLWAWRRQRKVAEPEPDDPRDGERIVAARAALDVCVDDRTLAEYLAAHLDCSAAAVIGPGLAQRLTDAGVARYAAERTERLLERLQAARYGGASSSFDPALLSELQDAFTT